MADAVSRSASASDSDSSIEEDIDRWLVGPTSDSVAMRETQTFRLDDTNAMSTDAAAIEQAEGDSEKPSDGEAADSEAEEQADSKINKGKKTVGKLPPLPPKNSAKDSREAAANVLRDMARRR